MAGCRRLTEQEIVLVLNVLTNPRDRCLFVVGLRTGFRIKELLCLTIGDVMDAVSQVPARLTVRKKYMKGGAERTRGRTVALHPEAIAAITSYVSTLTSPPPTSPLFPSQKGVIPGKVYPVGVLPGAITRFQAWHIIKSAFRKAGLQDAEVKMRLGTHSMRKVFAHRVFERLDRDILKTMRALGHDRSENTVRYLEVNQDEIDNAITSL